MFLLDILPEFVLNVVTLVAVVASFLLPILSSIPFIVQYRVGAQYVAAIILAVCMFLQGVSYTDGIWKSKNLEQQLKDAKTEVKAEQKSAEVVTRVETKIVKVKEKQDAIIVKVPVYITKEDDAKCVIPNSFVELFDYSVANEVPSSTAKVPEGNSDVTLSELQTTITKNNELYYELKTEYEGLLDWAIEQKKISDDNN